MRNLDTINSERLAILQNLTNAITANDTSAYSTAFNDLIANVEESVRGDFETVRDTYDANVLNSRGVRQLTSAEQTFYNKLIEGMKADAPLQALSGEDKVLPKTVIDSVFDDIKESHPLLSHINFQTTGALVKILLSTTSGVAAWGTITAEIESELGATFTEIDLSLAKLSAFIPVNKYMLELGPTWIDRYVRELLTEAIAAQLEAGIVDGTGKNQPIGMTRALSGAVDGVYPRKADAITATALDASIFATILNTLTQGLNGKRRVVNSLLMVVNPSDYFTKVYPAITVRAADGTFNQNVLPYPTNVVQSSAVPSGKAIFGIASRYFMGIGTSNSGGKIEFSDEYKFLEQVRTYLTYLYGYGRPLDANAFVSVDISGLVPHVQHVIVANSVDSPVYVEGIADARLASLSIGSLTLSPAFNKSTHEYTATTSNSTNTITAVAMNGDAEIEITNGETAVANGSAATWSAGANTVEVTVTLGEETETYTVTVTKS